MAWEDIAERLGGLGWVGAGLGAILMAPVLAPAASKGLRPLAKGAVKGYLTVTDRVREWAAESGEQWQDLVAEAKAEHEGQASGAEMMTMQAAPESGTPSAGEKATDEAAGEGEEHHPRRQSHRRQGEPHSEAA